MHNLYRLIEDLQVEATAATRTNDRPLADRLWAELRLLKAVVSLIEEPPSTQALIDAAQQVSMQDHKVID